MDYLRYILYGTELVAAVTGFVFRDKIRGTPWKWFLFYLFFIVAFETIGEILFQFDCKTLADHFYTYIVIQFQFISLYFIFYVQDKNNNSKKWLLSLITGYLLSICLEKFLHTGMNDWFDNLSYTIGVIGLVIFAIRYFDKLIQSEAILHFKNDLMFWVATGILFFYLGTLPYWGVPQSVSKKMPDFM
ncbi:MAG: hypothetical protein WAT91_16885, partial [Saprospiraceae bacterium]